MADASVSRPVAVVACLAMAVFYVAILYSPSLILRLPPPTSKSNFLIRRFVCAVVSSIASAFLTSCLLPIKTVQAWPLIFGTFGIRLDHLWQAVVIPVFLTSLLYSGSFVSKLLYLVGTWKQDKFVRITLQSVLNSFHSNVANVMAWRNYIVAPLTEELVFRACMIPLLLCGGFKTYHIIFLSPIFFSLAHLNHFLELYCVQSYSFFKAAVIVGNLFAPIVAHMFCNVMGLPVLSSPRARGLTIMASASGLVAFLWLLFPLTNPNLYNDRIDSCRCWQGYCNWN
ncbi:CAAX prenyl protease 2 isoform X2 [Aristolochia californica]|uniref:CAAX prenyl protease 2 isoform X2 n=1 Tax=Aristolochia californica TaxID=171875 RepID=UPI0035DDB4C6